MCRSIRRLHNFSPPATDAEIRAAALQYARKVSGTTRPSRANAVPFTGRLQGVRTTFVHPSCFASNSA
jgi:hypothetical protein